MMEQHTGFTGTRDGMTPLQSCALRTIIAQLVGWWHHGDCIGSDAQSHDLASELGLMTEIHPPLNSDLRAWCVGHIIRKPKRYIERNHDIVDATAAMIAAPSGMREELRSGTWATVRYARWKARPITVIYPDGSIEMQGAAR